MKPDCAPGPLPRVKHPCALHPGGPTLTLRPVGATDLDAARPAGPTIRLAVKDEEAPGNGGRAQRVAHEERDFEQFQQDIEEDEDLRKDVKLFKRKVKGSGAERRKAAAGEQGLSGGNQFASLDEETAAEEGAQGSDEETEADDEDDMPDVPIDELNELMGSLCVTGGGDAGGGNGIGDEGGDDGLSDDDDL
eukprot:g17613.t1